MVTATEPKKKTAKKPAKKKLNKSEVIEEAAELLKRIEKAEEKCQEARLAVDDAREGYKCAKQSYGACVEELRRLARARKEKLPLFDQKKADAKPEKAEATNANGGDHPKLDQSKPDIEHTGNAAKREAWRSFTVAKLIEYGASAKACDAVEASGLHLLGDLQDRMVRSGEWWAKDAGLHGRHKVSIEDAMNKLVSEAAEHPTTA